MLKSVIVGAVLSLALAGAALGQTCPTYTYVFSNGSTADASQVNANFNSILNCANTSLAPLANPHLTGAVGIGTTSPASDLHVVDNSNGQIGVRADNPNGGSGASALADFRNGGLSTSERLMVGVAGSGYTVVSGWQDAGLISAQSGLSGGLVLNANTGGMFFETGGNGASYRRMFIDPSSGYVGIGTIFPNYLLTVSGTVSAVSYVTTSDIRLKDRIQALKPGALSLVQKLRPVSFVWKKPTDNGTRGEQMGFVAQEVQNVLPSAVLVGRDKDKTLGIKYNELIPLLTAAIQEQQAEIEALKAQVAALKSGH